MPTFSISTNLTRDQISKDFISAASKLIASALGKPETYVLIHVNPGQLMSFGGTDEPCALISLGSIGGVGGDKNRNLAPKLSQFIEQHLGIKKDRFYINITDIDASTCGWNGGTFGWNIAAQVSSVCLALLSRLLLFFLLTSFMSLNISIVVCFKDF